MKRQVSGIYIFSSYGGGSDFNTVIDNGCYDCYNEGSGIGFGIYISANSDENSIIGNTCLDNERMILNSIYFGFLLLK